MRFLGMSLCCPDPFDKRRDEEAITRRMTGTRHQVNDLLQEGWEVYTVDEVRARHEAETRRMWLPRGRRTRLYVDREKASQSFFGAPGLTTRKMRIYPVEGNQNTEQTILMTGPPPTRDRGRKEDRRRPGQRQVPPRQGPDRPLRPRPGPGRITPIYLPPYAPDHNPTEHVWNAAKNNIANLQRDTPEKTFTAFTTYITNRTFDYDLEHLPTTPPHTDLV